MARGAFASTFGSGLQGGLKGAEVGAIGGTTGALIGAGIGTGLGAIGGYMAGEADAPMDEAQLEELMLKNKITKMQYLQMLDEMRAKKNAQRAQSNLGAKVAERLRASGAGNTFSNTFGGQNG